MQLVLNVSDEVFGATIEKQLASVKSEDLQVALTDAIKEYFSQKENLEKILFDQGSLSYTSGRKLSEPFKQVIASLDYSQLQTVADECINCLSTRYESLLRSVFTQMIVDHLVSDYSFQTALQSAVSQALYLQQSQQ